MYSSPSCQIVSRPTFRGVTREGACVCACESLCSPYFPNDLSGCSGAISGLASQTGNCSPSIFTLHIHPRTQSHSLSFGSHRARAPHQELGSVITEKFAFSPTHVPPAPPPPPSLLLSLHPVACCSRNMLKCSLWLN